MNEQRRRALGWVAVFLLALSLRVGAVVVRPPGFDGDQEAYLELAVSMTRAQGYLLDSGAHVTIHPLLPTLLAVTVPFGSTPRMAGIALTILIGALLPVIAGRTIATMLGAACGFGAAFLLAVQPHHVFRSGYLEPDLLAAALGFWLVWLLLRREALFAGVALGLAYLNRPEWFLLFPLGVAALWSGRAGRAARLARFALPFLVLSATFMIFLRAETGRWTLSEKDHWQYQVGVHQWRTRNQPLEPWMIPALERDAPSAVAHVTSHPAEAFLGYAYRWTILLRNLWHQIGIPLLAFLVVGAVQAWKTSRRDFLLLLLPLSLLPVLAAVGTIYRHSLVAGAVLVAVSGAGFVVAIRSFVAGYGRLAR